FRVDSPMWPMTMQIRRAAGIEPHDTHAAALDKLATLPGVTPAVLPALAALLDLQPDGRCARLDGSAQERRSAMLDALVDWLLRLAQERPLLLSVEDAHWMDPTSLEFLARCLGAADSARIMVLMSCRPGDVPALAAHPLMQRLALNRLGRPAVQ